MEELKVADFGGVIADRIRAEHVTLAARWLDRLRALIPVEASAVFPSEALLDHIPMLIREIATYLAVPENEAVAANTAVISKAQELGRLRHEQQASVHQLLSEYRLLGGILSTFVQEEVERQPSHPAPEQIVIVLRRMNDALWVLMQTTVDTFVTEYTTTIAAHADRLDSFNRMVSHELRQPLSTLLYALPMMRPASDLTVDNRHERLVFVMERNVRKLMTLMDQLEGMSRLRTADADAPHMQRVELTSMAREIGRQLREMADERGVELLVADGLPSVDVDAGRLELILMNLMSNGIKYSDPNKSTRHVRVNQAPTAPEGCVTILVEDNGIGIPSDQRAAIFGRFVRAHAELDSELGVRGAGLGLSIAAECAAGIGGKIRVESVLGEGTTFLLDLPLQAAS